MFRQTTNTRFQRLLEQYEKINTGQGDAIFMITINIIDSIGKPEFFNYQKDVQTYIQFVANQVNEYSKFPALKLVILLHRLLLLIESKQCSILLAFRLNFLQTLDSWLRKINKKLPKAQTGNNKNSFVFIESILVPYIFYLQKKIQFLQIKLIEQQQQINKLQFRHPPRDKKINSLENEQDEEQKNKKMLEEHYQVCYKYLNLLNKGLKFSNKFLSLIRYNQMQNWSLTDLNVILGQDFQSLYQQIAKQIALIKKIEAQMDIESLEYIQMLKQIQKINEGMYIIFLNKYNGYYLAKHTPQWIDVSGKFSKQAKIKQVTKWEDGQQYFKTNQSQQYSSRYRSKTTVCDFSLCINNQQMETDISVYKTVRCPTERDNKQIQRLQLLQELEKNFKKNLTKDQQINLVTKRQIKVRKNRSFYEPKRPQKLFL